MSSTDLWTAPAVQQNDPRNRFLHFLLLVAFLLLGSPAEPRAVESSAQSSSTGKSESTNSEAVLKSYLQLQEQLHATQIAIQRNREEADATAARNAEALANRLQMIEQSLSGQRARELEAMQSSNRVMLIVAGTFAAIGFCAVLVMAYFQWRAVNRLAEISTALPGVRTFGAGSPVPALGPGHQPLVTLGAAEQSNLRLLGALEKLEKRIYELEQAPSPLTPSVPAKAGPQPGPSGNNGDLATVSRPRPAAIADTSQLSVLLGKGQSLLNLDQSQAALECFDEALRLEPDNSEALVKQALALEKLGRLEEAERCYDRAIAVDGSSTMAYLYKGGLYNRLERFTEALECYEKALHAREKRGT